jgi:hypothetical protein
MTKLARRFVPLTSSWGTSMPRWTNFTVATQNQLSFNKILETRIQQISAALPSQSNGDSSKTLVEESVRSIFTVFKEKAPKSTEGSLGGVGKDKKPNAAEDISTKFSRRVKNVMPAVTSSPVAPAIFRYGDSLAHRSKM